MIKNILLIICLLSASQIGYSQKQISLEEGRKMALEYNKRLKIANAIHQKSISNSKLAFTYFLPSIDIAGEYNYYTGMDDISINGFFLPTANSLEEAKAAKYSGQSDVYFPGINLKLDDIKYHTANISLGQAIYMGGKIRNTYKASKTAITISEYNISLNENQVVYKTDTDYWNLVSMNERVKVAERYVSLLTNLVKDLNNAYELEIKTKNELLKAQVQLNNAELNLFKLKNAKVLSRMSLNQTLGIDLNTEIILTDTVIKVDELRVENDFLSKALSERKELKILESQLAIKELELKNIKADYLPKITAGAAYTYSGKIDGLTTDDSNLIAGKISVNMPIFHWKEKKHKVKVKEFENLEAQIELEESKDFIRLEVQQSYFKLQESFKQLELSQKAMEQAQENLDITKTGFYEGLVSTTEYLDAQAFWQNASTELVVSKINCKLANIKYSISMGEDLIENKNNQ
ncbi:MAG: TolC family protein [Marinifilaceae bacterium]|jgi:outer membrane protein TolC|nr:TolC family protein [Marinifilaceae bacterium]